MAAYFHGNSEIQGGNDGLQTLILMNPGYVGFSETHQQPPSGSNNNLIFFNSNSPGNPLNLSHAPPPPPPPPPQQFVGVPLAAAAFSVPSQDAGNNNNNNNESISALHGFLARSSQYGFYNPSNDITAAREATRAHHQQQGLSLSLSSSQPPGFGNFTVAAREIVSSPTASASASVSTPGVIQQQVLQSINVPLSSKYMKAAQELLDEVVNVGKSMKAISNNSNEVVANNDVKKSKNMPTMTDMDGHKLDRGENSSKHDGGGAATTSAELSTAERQEIQMKKAKLLNMLDEVEQRYRHYHHQMQTVIHWLEQAAGIGSAKTYTALALQTISKQFRCLKDAIIGQIRSASKTLGEDDSLGGKIEGSRLKFVDNQLRQQRALQQLGMIQHNAWRPQRGLPERAVSVLRAWLFEHFLHPYPKDSDKMMLAKQTGLTRSQVSNWFINARVRLWKPMVEEMYLEEVKEHEQNGSDQEKTSKLVEQIEDSTTSRSIAPQKKSPGSDISHRISLIGSSPEIESISITQGSPKKPRSNEMLHSPNMDVKPNEEHMSMKFEDDRQDRDGFSLMGGPMNFMGGFGAYPIGDIARFSTEQFTTPYSASGTVSLTLGLPHNENLSMTTHHSFLPIPTQNIQIGEANHEFGSLNTPTSAHSTASVYENFNIQNRKRFAAPLLPDFVA